MAPFPEEVDVFTVPHSRMKRLVEGYSEKLGCTDFSDYDALTSLLGSLHKTFCEFRCHERIENQFIMKKLKKKLKALSIQDSAVCNCHSDNRLSDILALVRDGYACTDQSERVHYGQKLQHALDEFTEVFLPHMKEEEEVFQPMLIQYFGYEELRSLKELVIREHTKWLEQCFKEKCCSELENVDQKEDEDVAAQVAGTCSFEDMPEELVLKVLAYLNPHDLLKSGAVCRRWYQLSRDPLLWRDFLPVHWARGAWNKPRDLLLEPPLSEHKGKSRDEDADWDESSGTSSEDEGESMPVTNDFQLLQRETTVLNACIRHLLPRIGQGVRRIVLATSKPLNNRMLRSILRHCPHVRYLDVSYTQTGDAAFKGLQEHGTCSSLEYLDLSGCPGFTDVGLERLGRCLMQLRDASTHDAHEENSLCRSSLIAKPLLCGVRRFCSTCPYRSRCGGVISFSSGQQKTCSTEAASPGQVGLKHLNLSGCFQVTDDGLLFMADQGLLSKLEYLDASGCFRLSGDALREAILCAPRLLPENLFYCDYVDGGPYHESANGCQNLQCSIRACCCVGQ
uniref:Putativereceptor for ubiquitination targets n=1 Tax=Ornithodoros turicata TaxID=34597 RepID=A0A2R5LA06_9ACAR